MKNLLGEEAADDAGEGVAIWLGAAAFLLIYNISFSFNESLSTARVVVLLLFFSVILRGWWINIPIDQRLYLVFLPVPYACVQFLLTRDSVQFSRFFHLGVYSYFGAFLVASLCRGVDSLLRTLLLAISLQSILLFFSFFSSEYRAWVDSWIVLSANFDAENIYRAPGLTSSAGSALSVIQSLGVLLGGMIIWRQFERGRKPSVIVLFSMLLNLLSCVLVGRTGLILSAFYFLIFSWRAKVLWKALSIALLVIAPCVVIGWSFLASLLPVGFSEDFFLDWAFGFLAGDNHSVSDLSSMPIPPLSLDTFVGTGLVGLIDGANPSGHDSGYVQGYFSLGLVMSGVFYVSYGIALWASLRWLPVILRLGITTAMLAIEVKEPFVFKYSGMFVLMAVYFSTKINRHGPFESS